MSNLFLKIKVWTKIALFAAACFYLLAFLLENAGKEVTIWIWFYHEVDTSLLKLIPSLLAAGVIGTLLVRMVIGTIRQFRQLKVQSQAARMQADLEEMKAKAEMLEQKSSDPVPPADNVRHE